MTPQEILAKCAEIGVKLQVRDGKLAPAGSLPVSFIKLSQQFIPYKKELIEYIQANMPELVVNTGSPEQKIAYNVAGTPNDKVMRLRIPCVSLGNPLEKASGCGCAGNVTYECKVFGTCRRAGIHENTAVCTSCDKYEPSK
jgi:hypothetical protein